MPGLYSLIIVIIMLNYSCICILGFFRYSCIRVSGLLKYSCIRVPAFRRGYNLYFPMFKILTYNGPKPNRPYFDSVVVGSGPNGLAAAITLLKEGLSVLLLEKHSTGGGGARSTECMFPGFTNDVCSAIHPLAAESFFFKSLHLPHSALEFIKPPLAMAHPFENGDAVFLSSSPELTAQSLQQDAANYLHLIKPLLKDWPEISKDILGPLRIPDHPLATGRFAWYGLSPVQHFAHHFKSPGSKAFIAGLGAHAMQPLSNKTTTAFALILALLGHTNGWPFPKGGAQRISDALFARFESLGGKSLLNFEVRSLDQLPPCSSVLLDITPRQLLKIAGDSFSSFYRWQLNKFRYGMGVFKVDYAMKEPVPFLASSCKKAATVHLGNSLQEIMKSEQDASRGIISQCPFVILAQPSLFDNTRAPHGKHTVWAYCHVPSRCKEDMTDIIEKQIERFAPGFKDCILARHIMPPDEMEAYNPNYIGGDINGGIQNMKQLFMRPALRLSPYRTSARGIYICSSSTPPGGGIHGLCGYYAAKRALKDIFHISLP